MIHNDMLLMIDYDNNDDNDNDSGIDGNDRK